MSVPVEGLLFVSDKASLLLTSFSVSPIYTVTSRFAITLSNRPSASHCLPVAISSAIWQRTQLTEEGSIVAGPERVEL